MGSRLAKRANGDQPHSCHRYRFPLGSMLCTAVSLLVAGQDGAAVRADARSRCDPPSAVRAPFLLVGGRDRDLYKEQQHGQGTQHRSGHDTYRRREAATLRRNIANQASEPDPPEQQSSHALSFDGLGAVYSATPSERWIRCARRPTRLVSDLREPTLPPNHHDSPMVNIVVLVREVTEENGPLCLLAASTRRFVASAGGAGPWGSTPTQLKTAMGAELTPAVTS